MSVYESSRQVFWKAKNRVAKHERLKKRYPAHYLEAAKKPVDENKVVFIEIRLPELTNSFQTMYKELSLHYDFDIHCHFLRTTFVSKKEHEQRCLDMIEDIATAKYVFLNEASNIIGSLPIRKETIITQLWHGCGAFKKFGMSTADLIFGDNKKTMLKYPFNKNYTHVTVSSPEVIWAYEEAMNIKPEEGIVKALGSSRTDVFFDDMFIHNAYQKLYDLMPEAKGKKVILFAPTFRGRVAAATSPECFDVDMFAKHFSDDYVLLFKHHPLVRIRPEIPAEHNDFAKDFTDTMAIDELLCVSDICISDYSSLVFEYSLFEKPMIFYAYDLDEYFDWRGFYYDYHELAPGPIVTTNEEMVDYIENIEERFDQNKVREFKEKFMSACDGHATQTILNTVLGEEGMQKHHFGYDTFKDHVKATVILMIKDCEKEISACVENIMMQSLKEIQIICVNMSAKGDDSDKILEYYTAKDDRITVIRSEQKDWDAARQEALNKATGEYVIFANCNEMFEKDALSQMYEKAKNDEAVICSCNLEYLPKKEAVSALDIADAVFTYAGCELWNKMIQRDFIMKQGLALSGDNENELSFVMDALFEADKLVAIPEDLITRKEQIMSDCSVYGRVDVCDIYKTIFDMLKTKENYQAMEKSLLNSILQGLTTALRSQKNVSDFTKLYQSIQGDALQYFGMNQKSKDFFTKNNYEELQNIQKMDMNEYLYYAFKQAQLGKES